MKKNDQSSNNSKLPISKANNNLELSSKIEERKNILNDVPNDFIETEKNKSSDTNFKKRSNRDQKKNRIQIDWTKMKSMVKFQDIHSQV